MSAPSPSNKFRDLRDNYFVPGNYSKPFLAWYTGGDPTKLRTLFPAALGYQAENIGSPQDTDESVLCWQLQSTDYPKGWRCFKVSGLTIVGPPVGPVPPWPNPPHWDNDHPRHGGVQHVSHKSKYN